MVFPKLPDAADAKAQILPFLVTPYLVWAFVGDLWAAMWGMGPLTKSWWDLQD